MHSLPEKSPENPKLRANCSGPLLRQGRTGWPGAWEIVSHTYGFLVFEVLDLNAWAGDQNVLGTFGWRGRAHRDGQVPLELPRG